MIIILANAKIYLIRSKNIILIKDKIPYLLDILILTTTMEIWSDKILILEKVIEADLI